MCLIFGVSKAFWVHLKLAYASFPFCKNTTSAPMIFSSSNALEDLIGWPQLGQYGYNDEGEVEGEGVKKIYGLRAGGGKCPRFGRVENFFGAQWRTVKNYR
jgi:hypothetical protein